MNQSVTSESSPSAPPFAGLGRWRGRAVLIRRALLLRRTFTPIELLIVITIIGILAGLLLPTLARAKEQERKIGCLNNARHPRAGKSLWAYGWIGHGELSAVPTPFVGIAAEQAASLMNARTDSSTTPYRT